MNKWHHGTNGARSAWSNLRARRIGSKSGEGRYGKQAAGCDCIGLICVFHFRIDRRSCGRSRILQAIFPGCAQPGAWRTFQSPLCRRHAGSPLVVGVCGSLRMVSRSLVRRGRHRTRCPDAISEILQVGQGVGPPPSGRCAGGHPRPALEPGVCLSGRCDLLSGGQALVIHVRNSGIRVFARDAACA
jgi:hypothetical protein